MQGYSPELGRSTRIYEILSDSVEDTYRSNEKYPILLFMLSQALLVLVTRWSWMAAKCTASSQYGTRKATKWLRIPKIWLLKPYYKDLKGFHYFSVKRKKNWIRNLLDT